MGVDSLRLSLGVCGTRLMFVERREKLMGLTTPSSMGSVSRNVVSISDHTTLKRLCACVFVSSYECH